MRTHSRIIEIIHDSDDRSDVSQGWVRIIGRYELGHVLESFTFHIPHLENESVKEAPKIESRYEVSRSYPTFQRIQAVKENHEMLVILSASKSIHDSYERG